MRHRSQPQNVPLSAVLPRATPGEAGRVGKAGVQAGKAAHLSDLGTWRMLWPSALRPGQSLLHMGGNQGMGTLRGRMGTQLSLVLVENSKPRNHVWE